MQVRLCEAFCIKKINDNVHLVFVAQKGECCCLWNVAVCAATLFGVCLVCVRHHRPSIHGSELVCLCLCVCSELNILAMSAGVFLAGAKKNGVFPFQQVIGGILDPQASLTEHPLHV